MSPIGANPPDLPPARPGYRWIQIPVDPGTKASMRSPMLGRVRARLEIVLTDAEGRETVVWCSAPNGDGDAD